jgi:hypothetical protein
MTSLTKIPDSVLQFLTRRKIRGAGSPAQGSQKTTAPVRDPQEAILLDTIGVGCIVTTRGQNPFPEEEGEINFMHYSLHERSLLSPER